jgi:hypothetical protein
MVARGAPPAAASTRIAVSPPLSPYWKVNTNSCQWRGDARGAQGSGAAGVWAGMAVGGCLRCNRAWFNHRRGRGSPQARRPSTPLPAPWLWGQGSRRRMRQDTGSTLCSAWHVTLTHLQDVGAGGVRSNAEVELLQVALAHGVDNACVRCRVFAGCLGPCMARGRSDAKNACQGCMGVNWRSRHA